jgi:hypothetical protein
MIPLRRLREGKRFALVFCWDWDALLPPQARKQKRAEDGAPGVGFLSGYFF